MIIFDNVFFNNSSSPFNMVLNDGENKINDEDIFKNIYLKEKEVISGNIKINNNFLDVNSKYKPYLIDINSDVISLSCLYFIENDNFEVTKNDIKNKLIQVKMAGLLNDPSNKIRMIFNAIKSTYLAYTLLDFNKATNALYLNIIKENIKDINDFPIAIFESEKEMERKHFDEVVIVEDKKEVMVNKIEEEPNIENNRNTLIVKKEKKKRDSNYALYFKQNKIFMIFVILFSAFSIFSLFFMPNLLKENKIAIGVIFIIDFLLFLVLHIYLNISSLNSCKTSSEYPCLLFNTLSTIIGLGLAFGFSIMLLELNVFMDKGSFDWMLAIPSFIFSLLIAIYLIVIYFVKKYLAKKK